MNLKVEMEMEADIGRWVLEFLRSQKNRTKFDALINKMGLSISESHFQFLKANLLTHLRHHLSTLSITERTLLTLELFEELHLRAAAPISPSLPPAYCAIALECTLKYLELEPFPSTNPAYLTAVDRIWRHRFRELPRSSVLVSDELKRWSADIEASFHDPDVRERLGAMNTRRFAIQKLKLLLDEATKETSPSFLELAASMPIASDTVTDSDARLDAVKDIHPEPPVENQIENAWVENQCIEAPQCGDAAIDNQSKYASIENQSKDAPTENKSENKSNAGPIENQSKEAPIENQNKDAPTENQSNAAPIENQSKDASTGNKSNAAPMSSNAAPIESQSKAAPIENESKAAPIENESKAAPIENQSKAEDQHKNDPIEDELTDVDLQEHPDCHTIHNDDLAETAAACPSKVHNPSLMKRKDTAHTEEWDKTTGGLPEETSSRSCRIKLRSPKRKAVSPLKTYEPPRIVRRRKAKKWSALEEETLRAAVNKLGEGNWKSILDSHKDIFAERTAVDLKDKWRNLTRYGTN